MIEAILLGVFCISFILMSICIFTGDRKGMRLLAIVIPVLLLIIYIELEEAKIFDEYQDNMNIVMKNIVENKELLNLPTGYYYYKSNVTGSMIVETFIEKKTLEVRESVLRSLINTAIKKNICKNGWVDKDKIVCIINL